MPVGKPVWSNNGTWSRVHLADRLRRSSQVLSVIENTAYIFGGEVQPRQPVDSQLDVVSLSKTNELTLTTKSLSPSPNPRVGTASTTLNGSLYLFSGRGGTSMTPLDEQGALWRFSPAQSTWSLIHPADPSAPYPPARSYHCVASDGASTIFIHAGCPAEGRLSDLWLFNVDTRTWTQAAGAPAPSRGGASIAYLKDKLYRMNGFDGTTEQGGSIDVFDVGANTWSTERFEADGHNGPEARSVCALLPVRIAQREKLLTLFGERDPSVLGHAGAGKMLRDVWVYDVGEAWWTRLQPGGEEVPDARGWFDADVVRGDGRGNDSVVVHGGLAEGNERLGDVWLLSF